jgi:nicotinate-nucleotide adenylyltransferase
VRQTIGVFGGTFDPVHNGHIQMAVEARESLSLDEVRLIPCHRPPHREAPSVDSLQRLHLLSLAISGHQGLLVDDRELRRDTASYTVDTLISLRAELGAELSIVLMLGMDAFAHLTTWHQWQRLRELAHIAVIARPNSSAIVDGELKQWLSQVDDHSIVHQQAAGGVLMLTQSLLPISATAIRQQLKNGEEVTDLPPQVVEYINAQGFYKNHF